MFSFGFDSCFPQIFCKTQVKRSVALDKTLGTKFILKKENQHKSDISFSNFCKKNLKINVLRDFKLKTEGCTMFFLNLVASDGLYFIIHFIHKVIRRNAFQHIACRDRRNDPEPTLCQEPESCFHYL